MKSKSPLIMLEQLLMLLVFALAAALCLQAFTLADSLSKGAGQQDSAILEVQKAAETIKYCGGDMEQAAEMLDGQWNDNLLQVISDDCIIYAEKQDSGMAHMGSARLWADDDKGQELFAISVAWQNGGAS